MNENVFDKINAFIRNVEGSFVSTISAIAPWFAPLPAAVMSFMHMTGVLGFDAWVAWAVAITIEILGFSTISTWLSFWSWNRRYQSKDSLKRAPMGFVFGAFIFYLTIVISMNVLLDAAGYFPDVLNEKVIIVVVRGSLTLLTIPAGLIIATRVQHNDLIDEMRRAKEEKKLPKVSESFSKTSPTSWRSVRKSLSTAEVQFIQTAQVQDVMNQFNISERTAYNWQSYARRESK